MFESNHILFKSYYDVIDGITFNYHFLSVWIFNRNFTFIVSFVPSFLIEYEIYENIVTQWDELSGGPRAIFNGCLFGWNVPKQLYGKE
jgi:hypothetical protein